MRCNNCGWDNPDGKTVCEKCGNPLSGGSLYQSSVAHQVSSEDLGHTVREGQMFGSDMNISSYPTPEIATPSAPRRDDFQANMQQGGPQPKPASSFSGTVNPWMQQVKIPKCSLTPIRQYGEVGVLQTNVFQGESNDLNRANLDAENPTITSQVQAHLSLENGKWYLEDKSSQNTTFIHVSGRQELSDGDIVLMGNRMFVFKSEQ